MVNATSQTIVSELDALERHAKGTRCALEIGTYQGVSAARIARALAPDGLLYCVDPWPVAEGRSINPCWSICQRHLRRSGVQSRVRVLRGFSSDLTSQIPEQLDFAFVDGDHSWTGIETDWKIVSQRVLLGGIVCLHDSFVPPGEESWRRLDSCRYFEDIIRGDSRFSLIEAVHSLAVLRKIK
jgi:predicted O-methyltransferase YrrM